MRSFIRNIVYFDSVELSLTRVISRLKEHLNTTERSNHGAPEAGVLVPLFEKETVPHVLLTERASSLRKHSGQISFPGGKVEPQDSSIMDTALRETCEEVGISREKITVIDKFHDFWTPYYSCVTPILATIEYPVKYTRQKSEIASILEVPISDLLEPSIHHTETREYENEQYTLHFYDWEYKNQEYEIWGATAGVLTRILNIIQSENLSI